MSENLHLVFSKPPRWQAHDEFNAWYDAHLAEILVVPGFVAARRYELHSVSGSGGPAAYEYLSAYEIEGDPDEVMAELHNEEDSGRMQLPAWFPEIRFASFNCRSHGNATDPRLADHLYLVFSAPPVPIDDEEYVAWYKVHAAENTEVDGFLANWRFGLEPQVPDEGNPTTSTHLAVYEVTRDLADLRAGLDAAREAGDVSFPDWFGEIAFFSHDAIAIGPRVGEVP